MRVFYSDRDREKYLRLLSRQGRRFGLTFLSYCLMPNHIHLIAVPQETDSLARAIGEAHRLYTRAVNYREGVKGYLFQGRFSSCPLDERHFIAAVRYIGRNPVRAGLAEQAWDYPWSSAAFHAGLRKEDPLVQESSLLALVGDWKELLGTDPEEIPMLREKVRTGRPCGESEFVRKAEEISGRRLIYLPVGRPYKEKK